MGQYHLIANLDKREYLYPHEFGDGFKLMEFGQSAGGPLTGLAVLLAATNGRGGGDFWDPGVDVYDQAWSPTGRWVGDRIAIIGDYFENGDVPDLTVLDMQDLWSDEPQTWTNISSLVAASLLEAGEMGSHQEHRLTTRG